jgi:hypothetical protein
LSSHLRFSHDDYEVLRAACSRLAGVFVPHEFQDALANALRQSHAALAERVAKLSPAQVGLLVDHFDGGEGDTQPANESCCPELTAQEWLVVWRACQVVALHGESSAARLLCEVARTEPRLAGRLVRLTHEQLAALLQRVEGRRWCP